MTDLGLTQRELGEIGDEAVADWRSVAAELRHQMLGEGAPVAGRVGARIRVALAARGLPQARVMAVSEEPSP